MNKKDPLDLLLREWHSVEPAPGFDARVAAAYRARASEAFWKRLWSVRVQVPLPVFAVAALAIIALAVWLRPARTPGAAPPPQFVTLLNATGFQPLPNGAARIVSLKQTKQ